jgi:hypothetical protein
VAGSDDDVLTIAFVGEEWKVAPSATFTFGRAGDLAVDEANPYLHRIVGRFLCHQGVWWLENLGDRVDVELVTEGGARTRLPARAGGDSPVLATVTAPRFTVTFEAGGLRYELEGRLARPPVTPGPAPRGPAGASTSSFGDVRLTEDEKAMVLALAEPCLRDPSAGPDALPANRQVAHALGWPITKFNRKLDYLCQRLSRQGVGGLSGGRGSEATNRRWRLVEHAIAARLVTPRDLAPPTAGADDTHETHG